MDVSREDLCLFLNACSVATGQREFYSSDTEQQVSLRFLHQYICVNYRMPYARTLAAGVNHFNQCEIILQLLKSGKDCKPENRAEENALITASLAALPPQRAWKLITRLQKERVNNRRTRSVIQGFIENRKDQSFDAVKYRSKFKAAVQHSHMKLHGELPVFLFHGIKKSFQTPLFESFRAAHFSKKHIYELPYSIAEGFAAKHKIDREEFLKQIEPRLTERERLRLQEASDGKVKINPAKLSLTELCVYILSLPLDERNQRRAELDSWIDAAAGVLLQKTGEFPLSGKVAAVLDNSYSSSGSREKQARPLAVALATHLVLSKACSKYRAFWTSNLDDALLVYPRGQSYLTERILDALDWGAETVVLVSDGCENDVPKAAELILRAYTKYGGKAGFIHLNPVFDPDSFQVASILPDMPALGLRTGEDLATTLAFGKFSCGKSDFTELENYLKERADSLVRNSYA